MKFLKTLLWVIVAALAAMFAARNWRDVTLDLWGDLQADIKIPVLMVAMILLGFIPSLADLPRAPLADGPRRRSAARVPAPVADDEDEEAAA